MASNTNDLFNSHEMEEGGGGQFVDPTIGVHDVLGTSHTSIIQALNKLYIGGIWWVGFSKLSLPLEPMLDPLVSFIFHVFNFDFRGLGLGF